MSRLLQCLWVRKVKWEKRTCLFIQLSNRKTYAMLVNVLKRNMTLELLQINGQDNYDTIGLCIMLETLCTPHNITRLELFHVTLNASSLHALSEVLKHNTTIQSLYLCHNGICNLYHNITRALHHNTTLQYLALKWNYLSYNAGLAISQMLICNHTLRFLELDDNVIEPWVDALAMALCKNTALRYLGLRNTYLKNYGVKSIFDMLKQNRSLLGLDLSDAHCHASMYSVFLAVLPYNRVIHYLNFYDNGVSAAELSIGKAIMLQHRIWSPQRHHLFPMVNQSIIWTILFISNRIQCLPNELWYLIFTYWYF